ncbi:3-phosphoshikimate 1-carboxyvinyltransferase [Marinivivus vitaminiproducens]|uniref:3-phosphoshikimate 1-carboxyvinyltransferase n=1 Tax=Marinivivus vitaminiproducens TaxID=3035935 RepID=UPI0027A17828|nr:3-phosphoshikimate 1-carboxyvinyltransferase [Geminicoccaceae bacterium SCSIO 64248]
MRLRAHPCGPLTGRLRVPGDKSLSHRALMLSAMAVGESRITGLLEGEDVLATAGALRRLGVDVARAEDGGWHVHGVGVGGFAEPDGVLDLGNAGTGVRLLMGLLAGHGFTSFLTGDASLRSRPMGRILTPLERMGAQATARSRVRLPLALTGSADLVPITYETPVASAQIKSAVLLAGLHAPGRTTVIESARSRDHTERMLRLMGASITTGEGERGGHAVTVTGQVELAPAAFDLPADPSSAAFPLVAALLRPHSDVVLPDIMANPLRTGLLATLAEMGAEIEILDGREQSGERVADLRVRASALKGVTVPADRAPSMIDEYPVLAVAAAFAEGTTVMDGLGELRVKETDRLSVMAEGLTACGAAVEVEDDRLVVHGRGRPPAGGAVIDARHDHRIAMSFLVLGGAAERAVEVTGAETIATSFPDFVGAMNSLGCSLAEVEEGA